MRLFNEADISSVLTPQLALDSLRGALDEQSAGLVQMPPRQTTDAGNNATGLDKHHGANWLRISTAFLNGQGVMGYKAMNRAAGIGMRYLIGLYKCESGELLAVMDANDITTARTAATSALGTDLLARPDSHTLGILGTGVQARALLRTYALLRPLEHVFVYSPSPDSRAAFVEYAVGELGIPTTAVDAPEQVTKSDTTVVAVRATREPVFLADWLRPGMHVTGLSSVRYDAREIDDAAWTKADLVVVDDRVNVSHSGDALSVAATGSMVVNDAAELFQLHAGQIARTSSAQVTLFKSAGNAMQDIALAAALHERLIESGVGADLGPFPEVKPYA